MANSCPFHFFFSSFLGSSFLLRQSQHRCPTALQLEQACVPFGPAPPGRFVPYQAPPPRPLPRNQGKGQNPDPPVSKELTPPGSEYDDFYVPKTPPLRPPLGDLDSLHGFFNPNPDPRDLPLYDNKQIIYGNLDGSPLRIQYNYTRHGRQLSWDWHNPTTEWWYDPDTSIEEWYTRAVHSDLDDTVFEEFLQWDQRPHQTSPTSARPRQLPNLVENPPRHSGQQQQPVIWPDNVYRDETPIEILQCYDTFDVSRPPSDQSPDQQEGPSGHMGSSDLTSVDSIMANISWEGGAKLIYYILSAVIWPSNGTGGNLPNISNVQEWHYWDLMCFPEAEWKEWKAACYDELESLEKCDVFELTDLPNGWKTIGCRWVFDIKGDSCKKARLVTQGFLQVEGVDYNKLFSPVVHFVSVHLMLALAALHNWYMTGVDTHTAYLYGKLDEEIYMHQPKGFIDRGQ